MTTFSERDGAKLDRLWAMQVFVRVAEAGGFSRAAASLDVANATVTACVHKLERHLGATLINRNTRFVSLTEPGERYLQHCKRILEAVDVAESDVETRVRELRGTLSVEIPVAIGQALVCPALPGFAARNPNLSVAVTLTNQPRNVIQAGTDVAIRMDPTREPDLIARSLCEASFILCGAPARVAALPAHPGQLDPAACLGLLRDDARSPVPWSLSLADEHIDLTPEGPLHFNSSEALMVAALAGMGLVRVADLFAMRHLQSGELVQYGADWDAGRQAFYAVTPKTQAMPGKVRAFIEFLQDIFKASAQAQRWQPTPVRRSRRAV